MYLYSMIIFVYLTPSIIDHRYTIDRLINYPSIIINIILITIDRIIHKQEM